jgi:hypothetical protein
LVDEVQSAEASVCTTLSKASFQAPLLSTRQ